MTQPQNPGDALGLGWCASSVLSSLVMRRLRVPGWLRLGAGARRVPPPAARFLGGGALPQPSQPLHLGGVGPDDPPMTPVGQVARPYPAPLNPGVQARAGGGE